MHEPLRRWVLRVQVASLLRDCRCLHRPFSTCGSRACVMLQMLRTADHTRYTMLFHINYQQHATTCPTRDFASCKHAGGPTWKRMCRAKDLVRQSLTAALRHHADGVTAFICSLLVLTSFCSRGFQKILQGQAVSLYHSSGHAVSARTLTVNNVEAGLGTRGRNAFKPQRTPRSRNNSRLQQL